MSGAIKYAVAAVCAIVASGCACPSPKPAGQYQAGYAAAWKAAVKTGRRAALGDLRADPAFASQPLPVCADTVSYLPRRPNVTGDVYLEARETNMRLLKRCRRSSVHNATVAGRRYRALMEAR